MYSRIDSTAARRRDRGELFLMYIFIHIQILRQADEAQDDNSRDRFVAAITMVTNGPLKTAAADNKYAQSAILSLSYP